MARKNAKPEVGDLEVATLGKQQGRLYQETFFEEVSLKEPYLLSASVMMYGFKINSANVMFMNSTLNNFARSRSEDRSAEWCGLWIESFECFCFSRGKDSLPNLHNFC